MSQKVCAIVGFGTGVSMGVARAFRKEGYNLALVARNPSKLAENARSLNVEGVIVKSFPADAGDEASVIQAFTNIRAELGDPEVLIYNAAGFAPGKPTSLTAQGIVADFQVAIAMERNWRQQMPDTRSAELCRQLGEVLFKTKAGMGTPKYIVVNDDIDITNTKEVVWAFATRNYPGSKGEVIFNDASTNPLVAFLEKGEKMSMHTTKVMYNCLPPDEWGDRLPQRSSFAGAYPQALQAQVLENWQTYGFSH